MRSLPELFANNRAWARERRSEDPNYFSRLSRGQTPGYLWIGCADSRVPPNEIVGLEPGELFVHRNVANVVAENDDNGGSALQFAVSALEVRHVIVCGHYGCGGVRAVLDGSATGTLGRWLRGVARVRDAHSDELAAIEDDETRWRRLCELNVVEQAEAVRTSAELREARDREDVPDVHAWIYDLETGLLRDLEPSSASEEGQES